MTAADRRFIAYHMVNPHVYTALVRLARGLVANGRRRFGIGMLFEVLRWETAMSTTGDDFKLNNNYRSRYARLIMATCPDLTDVFDTRELHT